MAAAEIKLWAIVNLLLGIFVKISSTETFCSAAGKRQRNSALKSPA
jgi:hypothetical protein